MQPPVDRRGAPGALSGGAVNRSEPLTNEVMDEPVFGKLDQRLEQLHARQRLGIERDDEAQIFGQGVTAQVA